MDNRTGRGDDDDFKAFYFGANIPADYKLENGLLIVANYNPSFSNIAPHSDSKFHNPGFVLRIGYMFGGSK